MSLIKQNASENESHPVQEQAWHSNAFPLLQDGEKINPLTSPEEFLKEVAPLLEQKDQVADWAEKRLAFILRNVDYDKLITAVDSGDTRYSPAFELWASFTSPSDSINFLKQHIDSIRNGETHSIDTALEIKNVIIDIGRLEKRTADYLLPVPKELEHVAPLDEVVARIEEVNELAREEGNFRVYSDTTVEMVRPPLSIGFISKEYTAEMLTQNPYLLDALSRRVVQQTEYLQSVGVRNEELLQTVDRQEKIDFLKQHIAFVLFLSPQNDEERIAVNNFAHANQRIYLDTQSEYYINKMYRNVQHMIHSAETEGSMGEKIVHDFPEITAEVALEILMDNTFALRIFTKWSDLPSGLLKVAIVDFIHLAREGKLSQEDARIFVVGMLHETRKLKTRFPEAEWLSDAVTVPEMDISEVLDDDHAYIDVQYLKDRLLVLQKLLGAPLGLLIDVIDVLPAEYYDESLHRQVRVTNTCRQDSYEFRQYELGKSHIRTIMHELGEVIVARLPLESIERYAQIFQQSQNGPRKFMTAYVENEWTEGNVARSIKEDLCETIAEFCGSSESNIALFKTCPNRYYFALALIAQFIKADQRNAFMAALLSFAMDKNDVPPLPEVVPWRVDADAIIYISGEAKGAKKRLAQALKREIRQDDVLEKRSIQVRVAGLVVLE